MTERYSWKDYLLFSQIWLICVFAYADVSQLTTFKRSPALGSHLDMPYIPKCFSTEAFNFQIQLIMVFATCFRENPNKQH